MIGALSSWQAHVFCSIVHGVSSILHLAAESAFDIDSVVPVYRLQRHGRDVRPHVALVGGISVLAASGVFLLITSWMHAFYAYKTYTDPGDIPGAKWRMAEYSVTAPIMIVIIALLLGVAEVYSLVGIWGLCMTTMVFGAFTAVSPLAHAAGYVPYMIMWTILMIAFGVAVNDSDENVPAFVWVIVLFEFFLFSAFGLVQFTFEVLPAITPKSKKHRPVSKQEAWETLRKTDGWYNLLSLTSKLLLAWLAFGGIQGMND